LNSVTSGHQNAGQDHNIKTDAKLIENVAKFKYLGTTATHKNYVYEEVKSKLNSKNVCYHSVQNLLHSHFVSKNQNINTHNNEILLFVLYSCEILPLTLREGHGRHLSRKCKEYLDIRKRK